MRQRRQPVAHRRQARRAHNRSRIGQHTGIVQHAGVAQILARQVNPPPAGVFLNVAQNIRKLQGATQSIRDAVRGGRGVAKRPDRQAPHRRSDLIAVTIEVLHRRRHDHGFRIGFHPVYHRDEIVSPQLEHWHSRRQHAGHRIHRMAAIQCGDIVAPGRQPQTFLFQRSRFISDIIHQAAERVDRVHRMTPVRRQHPHAVVERRTRRAHDRFDCVQIVPRDAQRRGRHGYAYQRRGSSTHTR